jgi:hypothetical protein
MDKVTQQNAASSEQSSAAAAELSGQSSDLKALVGTFRLEHSRAAARRAESAAGKPLPASGPPRARAAAKAAAPPAVPFRPEGIVPLDGDPRVPQP